MSDLFADGGIVMLLLLFMFIELIVLILVRKKTARYMPPLHVAVSLGAGAALLLALREALLAAAWPAIAIWLFAALGCHLWDLKRRWAP